MREKHQELHAQFAATFAPEIIRKWEQLVADWYDDPSKKNPHMEMAMSG